MKIETKAEDCLYVALNPDDGFEIMEKVFGMGERLSPVVKNFKVDGVVFPRIHEQVKPITGLGNIFADPKFFDTPDTLARLANEILLHLDIRMCTLHARGGIAMMRAFRKGIDQAARKAMREMSGWEWESRPKLIAVTLMTNEPPSVKRVLELAGNALKAGMDGITCPPYAIRAVRRRFGKKLIIVAPGIRFRRERRNNHVMTATPFEAIRDGANYVVMGRSITKAKDPIAAAGRAIRQIARGLKARK